MKLEEKKHWVICFSVHKGVDIRHTWRFLPCHGSLLGSILTKWPGTHKILSEGILAGSCCVLLSFPPQLWQKSKIHTQNVPIFIPKLHFILTQCERKDLKLMRIQQLTVKTSLLPHHRQVVVCYFLSSFTSKLLCYRQTGCDSYIWKKKREWQMCQNNIGKLNSSEKRSSLQRHNQQKKVQLGLCWNFTMSYIKSCDFSFSWSNYFCLCMHQPSWPSSRTLTSLLFI